MFGRNARLKRTPFNRTTATRNVFKDDERPQQVADRNRVRALAVLRNLRELRNAYSYLVGLGENVRYVAIRDIDPSVDFPNIVLDYRSRRGNVAAAVAAMCTMIDVVTKRVEMKPCSSADGMLCEIVGAKGGDSGGSSRFLYVVVSIVIGAGIFSVLLATYLGAVAIVTKCKKCRN